MSTTLYKNNSNSSYTGSTTVTTQDTHTITGGTVANGDTLRISRLNTKTNGGSPAAYTCSLKLSGVDVSSNPVSTTVSSVSSASGSNLSIENLLTVHFLNGGNQVNMNNSQQAGLGFTANTAITTILDPTQNITVDFNTQLTNAGDTAIYVGGYIEQL